MLFCYIFAMWFIVSQVAGGIALVLVVIGYFVKDKIKFLFLNAIANVFYALSFIFANSFVAGIGTFISILRVFLLFIFEKKNKPYPIYLLIIFSIVYIINGIIFFTDFYDIIPICTSILFSSAMWIKNMEYVRYAMLLPNILITIYALIRAVYTSALLDFMEVVVIIVAIIYFHIKKKKEFNLDLM